MSETDIMRKAITDFLDGNYERPVGIVFRSDGKPSKHDRCIHDAWMYEGCEACIERHFLAALTKIDAK